ncbi:hypothetical protein Mgra_00004703 [Meloidogyne graminicola]|uniref:V-type proton ATPase subunit S1/VOA1 transmembrane domain-containing protein n=1 Tax=Meloidogyne graminicola TaxID=189291 RepID=A0A8S9ZQT8_9BILA|nr:hypothetical protein Mgra_00004703 [Meloidogyne graminicola]
MRLTKNCNFFIYKLFLIICAISPIRGPKTIEDDSSTTKGLFPIVLPSKKVEKDGSGSYIRANNDNPCLLYIESISAVLYNVNEKKSAWATINSTLKQAEYEGLIQCPKEHNTGQQFSIELKATAGNAKAVPGYYIGEKDKEIFFLNKIDVVLIFNFTQSSYWQLVNVDVGEIKLTAGTEKEIPSVDSNWQLVSGINNKQQWIFTDSQSPAWNINGFKDYSYSCARTSPIVWAKKDNEKYAVGLVFGNIQFQLNSIYSDNGVNKTKFGWRVNDCAPTFSIGTWMILLVFIILIGVLSFGFLMLNSVQTMSRFDDPKQKQIIISSKEN